MASDVDRRASKKMEYEFIAVERWLIIDHINDRSQECLGGDINPIGAEMVPRPMERNLGDFRFECCCALNDGTDDVGSVFRTYVLAHSDGTITFNIVRACGKYGPTMKELHREAITDLRNRCHQDSFSGVSRPPNMK
jgi:hypothetical protein